jgi:outer membrane protein OmpA-like peptidoglycan-associated protein
MDLLNGISKPAGQLPSRAEKSTGRKSFVWAVFALALLAISAVFWRKLNSLNLQIADLGQQVESANQRLGRVEARAEASLQRASQAEASARQAAVERDQAQRSEAKSAQEATLAREQAKSAQVEAASAQQKAEEYRKQREEELANLQQTLNQIAETRRTAMGLVMTLGSNSIKFDFDKSDLRPENREVLSRIAGVLMNLKGYSIYVYGYTDDVGSQEYNQKLSERRAKAVRDYLVQAGLDPGIMSARGYGKSDPRVRGNSSDARTANRRVEIGIVDSRLRFQEVPPPGG